MSRTLSLSQHLLFEARRYRNSGADEQALRIYGNLAALRDLPPDIAEETQFSLAELMLNQRQFAKARRHLTAALVHDPENPEYHYLLACAHNEDRRGERRLALRHYRRCVELDPENPYYHLDAGLFAVKHGQLEEGLCYVRRAAELAPDNAEIVGDVVRGLQDRGRHEEARSIAQAALFRNSRDARFQRLWNNFRFQELHQHQQQARKRRLQRRAAAEGPVRLPFLQLTVETPRGRKLVRQDKPSGTPAPHILRLARLSGKKHA